MKGYIIVESITLLMLLNGKTSCSPYNGAIFVGNICETSAMSWLSRWVVPLKNCFTRFSQLLSNIVLCHWTSYDGLHTLKSQANLSVCSTTNTKQSRSWASEPTMAATVSSPCSPAWSHTAVRIASLSPVVFFQSGWLDWRSKTNSTSVERGWGPDCWQAMIKFWSETCCFRGQVGQGMGLPLSQSQILQ